MSRGAFPLAWLGQLGPLLWRTSQHSLKRGTWPASSDWFGFCCSVLGPKFSSRSAWCQAPNPGDSSMVAGSKLLCPHGFLKEGEVTGPPSPRGRSSPSTPAEVPSKGPSLQRC
ncbi:hypothetical protein Nmel_004518 [Mimus melanotis]